jgi:hypothetical protein
MTEDGNIFNHEFHKPRLHGVITSFTKEKNVKNIFVPLVPSPCNLWLNNVSERRSGFLPIPIAIGRKQQ